VRTSLDPRGAGARTGPDLGLVRFRGHTRPARPLVRTWHERDDQAVEPLISHRDVTPIMELLGDMRADLHAIRVLLGEDDGEEEEDPQADT